MSHVDHITRAGMTRGVIDVAPLLLGVVPVGAIYGIAALEKGLSPIEVILTSAMIFGGASQFLAIELWQYPLPVVSLVVTVLAVNARHLVMGAALTPWLSKASDRKVFPSLYFMTDEIFGLMMKSQRAGRQPEIGEMLGAGIIFYLTWVGSTAIGVIFGAIITDPQAYGLDVLGVCFFVALLMAFWSGKADILPWAVAAGVSLAVGAVMTGSLNVIFGAVAGVAVGVWQDNRKSRGKADHGRE